MKQRWVNAGIFFVSLSVITFEISLTRLFSVTLWYHFAYFVISMAMFGLGGGGLAAFFFQDRFPRRLGQSLVAAALLQAASIVASLVVVLNFDLKVEFTRHGMLNLLLIYLVCAVPFFFAGITLAVLFRNLPGRTGTLYAFDLIGAACGCLVFVLAITYWSGPTVVMISALQSLAAAPCFALAGGVAVRATAAATAALAGGAVLLATATPALKVKYTKTYKEKSDVLYEKWSPLARITVYPNVFWVPVPESPFGWGMSRKIQPQAPIQQLWIEQDASAGTPITRFDGNLAKVDFLAWDITAFVYHVKERPRVFVVGSGGGRDVLTALRFGSPSVVACDINPVIIDLVRNRFREFAGNLYGLPQVHPLVADARHGIRQSTERFDVIQLSLIDSWAATAAGAFALAENSLYTVEAFTDYLRHLQPDGILTVSRYLFNPRNQSLRVAVLAREALELSGVEQPANHIAVVGTTAQEGVATILVKRTPFTSAELEAIMRTAGKLGFVPLYLPWRGGDKDFTRAIAGRDRREFIRTYLYDIRPTTDDRPFFFQMVRFADALDLVRGKPFSGALVNYYAVAVILMLIVISAVLTGVFFLLPLALRDRGGRPPAVWGLYFVLLGAGFMFVEIPLIQKGSLYLGHPTYGLIVVLFTILLFTGAGSFWSGKIGAERLATRLRALLAAAGVLITAVAAALEWLLPATVGAPFALKAALVVVCGGLVAFPMGTAFPSGIRLLGAGRERTIPWAWALNGGASVMGSILAMAGAMSLGYRLTLLLGAVIYLACAVVVILATRGPKPAQAGASAASPEPARVMPGTLG